jgi:hypothetical protein
MSASASSASSVALLAGTEDAWMEDEVRLDCTEDLRAQGVDECPVCLEELLPDGDDVAALPLCGHRLHVECLELARVHGMASVCPLCRRGVSDEEALGRVGEAPSDADVGTVCMNRVAFTVAACCCGWLVFRLLCEFAEAVL